MNTRKNALPVFFVLLFKRFTGFKDYEQNTEIEIAKFILLAENESFDSNMLIVLTLELRFFGVDVDHATGPCMLSWNRVSARFALQNSGKAKNLEMTEGFNCEQKWEKQEKRILSEKIDME